MHGWQPPASRARKHLVHSLQTGLGGIFCTDRSQPPFAPELGPSLRLVIHAG